ncbi:MAG TPA: four helix bundle protein [bacterium]|nr:four helix bundle protein [bacterium]
MKVTKFEDLKIWQASLAITKRIYDVSALGEFGRDYRLRDQIRGAIISVSSNIVEGFEKNNNNEFIRFLRIAKGSAGEARNQLYIAKAIDYIDEKSFAGINEMLEELAGQIGALIVYLQKNKAGKRSADKPVTRAFSGASAPENNPSTKKPGVK